MLGIRIDLRWRLAGIALVGLLGLVVVSLWAVRDNYDSLVRERERETRSLVEAAAALVTSYAEQARHFVEETLGVRPPAFLWGYNQAGDNAAYNQRITEVEPMARFLGMESPFPVTRLARFISGVSDPGTTMVDHTRDR